MLEKTVYTLSEEDHLKAIYAIQNKTGKGATTTAISRKLETKASSVTDMVKRLATKDLVDHRPYYGAKLTEKGNEVATALIRKHRLWETFLVEHLRFKWDQVHVIAEQLEHVNSPELVDRLDAFMNFPQFDPHGDPIPTKDGTLTPRTDTVLLTDVPSGERVVIQGLNDTADEFLKFLDGMGFKIGTQLMVMRRFELGNTIEVNTHFRDGITLVEDISKKINVRIL
jgi:DtxR family Mn-dependent transcriptional regulator